MQRPVAARAGLPDLSPLTARPNTSLNAGLNTSPNAGLKASPKASLNASLNAGRQRPLAERCRPNIVLLEGGRDERRASRSTTVLRPVRARRERILSKRRDEPEGRHRPIVMMVEDDPDDRQIYGTVLCYNGFDVLLAPDGLSALRNLALHHPDLVLLDLGLPDTDGLDLCRELIKREAGMPVIALSGFSEGVMGPKAREAGCTLYIEKPVSPVQVLHEIERFLGRPPPAGVGSPPGLIPHS